MLAQEHDFTMLTSAEIGTVSEVAVVHNSCFPELVGVGTMYDGQWLSDEMNNIATVSTCNGIPFCIRIGVDSHTTLTAMLLSRCMSWYSCGEGGVFKRRLLRRPMQRRSS